jgi:hypothetical protein
MESQNTMVSDKNEVTCCYGECPVTLVEVVLEQATVVESHALCGACRTIILCVQHFESLSGDTDGFLCPACKESDWQIVAKDSTSGEAAIQQLGCRPVYAHSYEASTRLLYGGVTVHKRVSGSRIRVIEGALDVTVKGEVVDTALSPSGERMGVICDFEGERILEVHTDTGRPWRLRSDEPLGINSVVFFDEHRLGALQTRHEGCLELVELRLEGGHMISTRRLAVVSASMPAPFRSLLVVTEADHVAVVTCSGALYWLDTFQMTTGKRIARVELPFLPTHLLAGPKGYIFVGKPDGPVSIVKGEHLVELFSHYDLLDAVFTSDGQLCISTSSHALQITLETGASIERQWSHPVLGILKDGAAHQ